MGESTATTLAEIRNGIEDAVSPTLRADVPRVGIALSGGIDLGRDRGDRATTLSRVDARLLRRVPGKTALR